MRFENLKGKFSKGMLGELAEIEMPTQSDELKKRKFIEKEEKSIAKQEEKEASGKGSQDFAGMPTQQVEEFSTKGKEKEEILYSDFAGTPTQQVEEFSTKGSGNSGTSLDTLIYRKNDISISEVSDTYDFKPPRTSVAGRRKRRTEPKRTLDSGGEYTNEILEGLREAGNLTIEYAKKKEEIIDLKKEAAGKDVYLVKDPNPTSIWPKHDLLSEEEKIELQKERAEIELKISATQEAARDLEDTKNGILQRKVFSDYEGFGSTGLHLGAGIGFGIIEGFSTPRAAFKTVAIEVTETAAVAFATGLIGTVPYLAVKYGKKLGRAYKAARFLAKHKKKTEYTLDTIVSVTSGLMEFKYEQELTGQDYSLYDQGASIVGVKIGLDVFRRGLGKAFDVGRGRTAASKLKIEGKTVPSDKMYQLTLSDWHNQLPKPLRLMVDPEGKTDTLMRYGEFSTAAIKEIGDVEKKVNTDIRDIENTTEVQEINAKIEIEENNGNTAIVKSLKDKKKKIIADAKEKIELEAKKETARIVVKYASQSKKFQEQIDATLESKKIVVDSMNEAQKHIDNEIKARKKELETAEKNVKYDEDGNPITGKIDEIREKINKLEATKVQYDYNIAEIEKAVEIATNPEMVIMGEVKANEELNKAKALIETLSEFSDNPEDISNILSLSKKIEEMKAKKKEIQEAYEAKKKEALEAGEEVDYSAFDGKGARQHMGQVFSEFLERHGLGGYFDFNIGETTMSSLGAYKSKYRDYEGWDELAKQLLMTRMAYKNEDLDLIIAQRTAEIDKIKAGKLRVEAAGLTVDWADYEKEVWELKTELNAAKSLKAARDAKKAPIQPTKKKLGATDKELVDLFNDFNKTSSEAAEIAKRYGLGGVFSFADGESKDLVGAFTSAPKEDALKGMKAVVKLAFGKNKKNLTTIINDLAKNGPGNTRVTAQKVKKTKIFSSQKALNEFLAFAHEFIENDKAGKAQSAESRAKFEKYNLSYDWEVGILLESVGNILEDATRPSNKDFIDFAKKHGIGLNDDWLTIQDGFKKLKYYDKEFYDLLDGRLDKTKAIEIVEGKISLAKNSIRFAEENLDIAIKNGDAKKKNQFQIMLEQKTEDLAVLEEMLPALKNVEKDGTIYVKNNGYAISFLDEQIDKYTKLAEKQQMILEEARKTGDKSQIDKAQKKVDENLKKAKEFQEQRDLLESQSGTAEAAAPTRSDIIDFIENSKWTMSKKDIIERVNKVKELSWVIDDLKNKIENAKKSIIMFEEDPSLVESYKKQLSVFQETLDLVDEVDAAETGRKPKKKKVKKKPKNTSRELDPEITKEYEAKLKDVDIEVEKLNTELKQAVVELKDSLAKGDLTNIDGVDAAIRRIESISKELEDIDGVDVKADAQKATTALLELRDAYEIVDKAEASANGRHYVLPSQKVVVDPADLRAAKLMKAYEVLEKYKGEEFLDSDMVLEMMAAKETIEKYSGGAMSIAKNMEIKGINRLLRKKKASISRYDRILREKGELSPKQAEKRAKLDKEIKDLENRRGYLKKTSVVPKKPVFNQFDTFADRVKKAYEHQIALRLQEITEMEAKEGLAGITLKKLKKKIEAAKETNNIPEADRLREIYAKKLKYDMMRDEVAQLRKNKGFEKTQIKFSKDIDESIEFILESMSRRLERHNEREIKGGEALPFEFSRAEARMVENLVNKYRKKYKTNYRDSVLSILDTFKRTVSDEDPYKYVNNLTPGTIAKVLRGEGNGAIKAFIEGITGTKMKDMKSGLSEMFGEITELTGAIDRAKKEGKAIDPAVSDGLLAAKKKLGKVFILFDKTIDEGKVSMLKHMDPADRVKFFSEAGMNFEGATPYEANKMTLAFIDGYEKIQVAVAQQNPSVDRMLAAGDLLSNSFDDMDAFFDAFGGKDFRVDDNVLLRTLMYDKAQSDASLLTYGMELKTFYNVIKNGGLSTGTVSGGVKLGSAGTKIGADLHKLVIEKFKTSLENDHGTLDPRAKSGKGEITKMNKALDVITVGLIGFTGHIEGYFNAISNSRRNSDLKSGKLDFKDTIKAVVGMPALGTANFVKTFGRQGYDIMRNAPILALEVARNTPRAIEAFLAGDAKLGMQKLNELSEVAKIHTMDLTKAERKVFGEMAVDLMGEMIRADKKLTIMGAIREIAMSSQANQERFKVKSTMKDTLRIIRMSEEHLTVIPPAYRKILKDNGIRTHEQYKEFLGIVRADDFDVNDMHRILSISDDPDDIHLKVASIITIIHDRNIELADNPFKTSSTGMNGLVERMSRLFKSFQYGLTMSDLNKVLYHTADDGSIKTNLSVNGAKHFVATAKNSPGESLLKGSAATLSLLGIAITGELAETGKQIMAGQSVQEALIELYADMQTEVENFVQSDDKPMQLLKLMGGTLANRAASVISGLMGTNIMSSGSFSPSAEQSLKSMGNLLGAATIGQVRKFGKLYIKSPLRTYLQVVSGMNYDTMTKRRVESDMSESINTVLLGTTDDISRHYRARMVDVYNSYSSYVQSVDRLGKIEAFLEYTDGARTIEMHIPEVLRANGRKVIKALSGINPVLALTAMAVDNETGVLAHPGKVKDIYNIILESVHGKMSDAEGYYESLLKKLEDEDGEYDKGE